MSKLIQHDIKHLPVLKNSINQNHQEAKHAQLVKQWMKDYLGWMEK